MPRERTYIMIKPDGVQRGLVGGIVARFEKKGFKLVAMKSVQPSKEHLETHYADLKSKKFFPGLIEYMLSGPVVCMVWEGLNAVKTGRRMLGETMPSNSAPGSIRGDLCIDVGRNICHGSDSVESANKEIALWFGAELNNYTDHSEGWVYEDEEAKGPILLGMGNPLLDISAEVPASEFEKWGAKEGNAMLADEGGKHTPMYADLIKNYDVEYIAGGATQNSIRVAAALGATCSYIGCIGKDDYGAQLKEAVAADNVTALYLEDESAPTGTCAVLVKDKERSLIANLAAANNYTPDAHMETAEVKAALASALYYYVAGFFLTVSPPAIMKVAQQAAADNKCFCLNLAAPFIAQFFGEPLAAALPYCDIVFGNETEAAAFAEKNGLADGSAVAVAQHIAALDKVNELRPRMCIITQGSEFTAVSIGGAAALKFTVKPLAKELIVDTNGAGDAFVGGFLSRYVKGATLADCVNAGHDTAALIIQESGCKMPSK